MYDYTYLNPTVKTSVDVGVWGIISAVTAIIGGILIYFLFINSKTKVTNKYLAWFKDFANFKKMLIEPLLKVTYLILAIYITLYSFGFIGTSFPLFLLILILGNLILRIAYEASIIIIMIWKNTDEINKNLKK